MQAGVSIPVVSPTCRTGRYEARRPDRQAHLRCHPGGEHPRLRRAAWRRPQGDAARVALPRSEGRAAAPNDLRGTEDGPCWWPVPQRSKANWRSDGARRTPIPSREVAAPTKPRRWDRQAVAHIRPTTPSSSCRANARRACASSSTRSRSAARPTRSRPSPWSALAAPTLRANPKVVRFAGWGSGTVWGSACWRRFFAPATRSRGRGPNPRASSASRKC
jgi:hypothetical protein